MKIVLVSIFLFTFLSGCLPIDKAESKANKPSWVSSLFYKEKVEKAAAQKQGISEVPCQSKWQTFQICKTLHPDCKCYRSFVDMIGGKVQTEYTVGSGVIASVNKLWTSDNLKNYMKVSQLTSGDDTPPKYIVKSSSDPETAVAYWVLEKDMAIVRATCPKVRIGNEMRDRQFRDCFVRMVTIAAIAESTLSESSKRNDFEY